VGLLCLLVYAKTALHRDVVPTLILSIEEGTIYEERPLFTKSAPFLTPSTGALFDNFGALHKCEMFFGCIDVPRNIYTRVLSICKIVFHPKNQQRQLRGLSTLIRSGALGATRLSSPSVGGGTHER